MDDDAPLIVTIDGPAGTGKSTVARLLARRLGIDLLDTGAMYRASAWIAIEKALTDDVLAGRHGDWLEAVIEADLHFDFSEDPPAILAWDRPLGEKIRGPEVTAIVSPISAVRALRKHLVQKQRIIGHQHPRLVTEGRDQGSVVFPDAPVKFYLDAAPAVRARRRADQIRETGGLADENELLEQILERDRRDSTRADGPLVKPHNAIELDTSSLDLDRVLDELERLSRDRLGALLARKA